MSKFSEAQIDFILRRMKARLLRRSAGRRAIRI
jgi:hypothetical protein